MSANVTTNDIPIRPTFDSAHESDFSANKETNTPAL
jgi:hypothetical protein